MPIGTDVGLRAPELAGELPTGESFLLDDQPGATTVLVFYRSAECGLCRVRIDRLQRHLPAYELAAVQVVALTLDAPEVSRQMVDSLQIEFPIVSVDTAIFQRWGAMDSTRSVALPATFLIDESGIIRFRHIGRNASDRTSDAELVAVIETLTSS